MSEQLSKEEFVAKYKGIIEPLMRYMPWLLQASGKTCDSIYGDDGISGNSLSFPVYDGTLMSFVKEMSRTSLMNRNYPYVYTKRGIKTPQDEIKAIQSATITDIDVLNGILSKYVLGGMTKGSLWSDAMKYGIFLEIVKKYKELLEFWEGTSMREY